MARKIKTVKIELDSGEIKDFVIKELTIQNIIDLSQQNSFFKSNDASDIKQSQNGEEPALQTGEQSFIQEILEYGKEIQEVMDKICDFSLSDLKELAPSDIRKLYDGFQEVNEDFLGVLRKLKILEMFSKMLEKHIKNFSKILAIL